MISAATPLPRAAARAHDEAPVVADDRILMVDALRGYALLGLFIVHMAEFFDVYWAHPSPSLVRTTIFTVFAGKSFAVLALCFGFSYYVMSANAARRGAPFAGRFAWRLAILAVAGLLHGLIYRGDILVVLASTGLLLVPLDLVRRNRVLVAVSALCFVQPILLSRLAAGLAGASWVVASPHFLTDPAMSSYVNGSLSDVLVANIRYGQVEKWWYFIETGRIVQVIGLFTIGLVLGRVGFFAEPWRFVRERHLALAAFMIAAVPILCGRVLLYQPAISGVAYYARILLSGWLNLLGTTVTMLIFVAVWEVGGDRWLRWLAPVGRMTLSLYVAQSLVFIPMFYGFGLDWSSWISEGTSVGIGLVVCAVQIAVANIWFGLYRFGPLEWAWRAATKLTLDVEFRRTPAQSPEGC